MSAINYCYSFFSYLFHNRNFFLELSFSVLLNIEPLVSYGIWKVEGIAVDWLAKNVYWVDSSLNQIEVKFCNILALKNVLLSRIKESIFSSKLILFS